MIGLPEVDRYNLQARVYPGAFTALPVVILALPFVTSKAAAVVTPVVIAGGVFFFLINFVRSQGLRVEGQLIGDWGGLPTTHMLRFREADNLSLLARRRRKIERVYGERLPDENTERADPEKADQIYVAAVRSLITKVNEDRERFPRVHDENIQYGFRRNLLGLKPYAIVLTLMCLAADVVIAWTGGNLVFQISIGIVHGALLSIWVFIVKPSWVREVADRYTYRLFEALDSLQK